MSMKAHLEKVDSLYRTEVSISDALSQSIIATQSAASEVTFEDKLEVARRFFLASPSGTDDVRYSQWGHYGSISLPTIISIQGQVIVDIKNIPIDSFPSEYGITFDQFKELARRNIIIPNVYEDGEMTAEFINTGRITASKYSANPELIELFDQDEFGTRILGVRRRSMIDCFLRTEGFSRSREGEKEHIKAMILNAVKKYDLDYLNETIVGPISHDHEGIAQRFAENLHYLDVFGDAADHQYLYNLLDSDSLDDFIDQETEYGSSAKFIDPVGFLLWTAGRKVNVASPFTAAYGGTYNNKSDEAALGVLFKSDNGPINEKGPEILHAITSNEERLALAKFQEVLATSRILSPWDIPDEPIRIYDSAYHFDIFTRFIEERLPLLQSADTAIWKNPDLDIDDHEMMDFGDWKTYAKVTKEIWSEPNDQSQRTVMRAAKYRALEVAGEKLAENLISAYAGYAIARSLSRRKFIQGSAAVFSAVVGSAAVAGVRQYLSSGAMLSDRVKSARRTLVYRTRQLADLPTPRYLE